MSSIFQQFTIAYFQLLLHVSWWLAVALLLLHISSSSEIQAGEQLLFGPCSCNRGGKIKRFGIITQWLLKLLLVWLLICYWPQQISSQGQSQPEGDVCSCRRNSVIHRKKWECLSFWRKVDLIIVNFNKIHHMY